MTSSSPHCIFTVIYDPETGLLFAPGNDVLVCDVPINEIETDTEQIEYIQTNGIKLKDVVRRGMAAYHGGQLNNVVYSGLNVYMAPTVHDISVAFPGVVRQTPARY